MKEKYELINVVSYCSDLYWLGWCAGRERVSESRSETCSELSLLCDNPRLISTLYDFRGYKMVPGLHSMAMLSCVPCG